MRKLSIFFIFTFLFLYGCNRTSKIDITPHIINIDANEFYQQALHIIDEYYDIDSTKKSIALLNKAIEIDNLNPDYYGLKAKVLAEMGLLDSALLVQSYANSIDAINGEYLLQLGLFQAAKGMRDESIISFKRSNDYLIEVLKAYPDSLGAFINQQAANALYTGIDSLFMNDVRNIRQRFPNRLMEIEMTRRLRPSSLVKQLQKIESDAIEDLILEIDQEHFLNNEDN